jgi:CHRD domain/FG-GAP-like repeat
MKFIETVLPKVSSVLVLTAMVLSSFVSAKANLFVFGADGKLVKKVELEADLTGNPIGGVTPTGKTTSDYFAGTQALLFERTRINNLNLPDTVTQLDYFLNNSTDVRASVSRFSEPGVWGSTFIFGGLSRIAIGSTVQFKNQENTVLSGTFARPVRDFEPFDTALVGRFTVPETPSTSDVGGLAEVQFYPTANRLHIDAGISELSQACTQITLNEGAAGQNGSVVASFTTTTGQGTAGFYCSAEGDVILTAQQVASLRSGNLYVVGLSSESPNGVRRGQLESSIANSDFTGDGKADISVYRPSTQTWYIQDSSNSNQFTAFNLGSSTSKSVAADYDGDSKADATVYEPATGVWRVKSSNGGFVKQIQWGIAGDIALSGKHFGSANDLVIFRPSNGTWYIKRFGDIIKPIAPDAPSNNNVNYQIFQWGQSGDKPVMADFNGDGRDELGIFRPSNGVWYIYNQITGTYKIQQFGIAEDIPVAADYDNDGKADVAVFRPSTGTWYIFESVERKVSIRQFGKNGDIPAVADFDKDGVADISVFRPTDGNWYRLNSSNNSFKVFNFGLNGDVPAVR